MDCFTIIYVYNIKLSIGIAGRCYAVFCLKILYMCRVLNELNTVTAI